MSAAKPHARSLRPFDAVAPDYDRTFTTTRLGRELRGLVWRRLAVLCAPGNSVLEFGCGTGEDALWLAERGMDVVATDVSEAMLEQTRRKAASSPAGSRITVVRLDLAAPECPRKGRAFDLALSNFGAFNCIADLAPISRALRDCVRPGGRVLVVLLGRCCLWEIVWNLLRGNAGAAFRRFHAQGMPATVGTEPCPIWYHTAKRVRTAFAGFRCVRTVGLGVFLPPSALGGLAERLPRLFNTLSHLESATHGSRLLAWAGDHVILEFERL